MAKSEPLVWSPKGSRQHQVLTRDKGKEKALQKLPEAFRGEREDLDAEFQMIHSPSGFTKRKSVLAPGQVTAASVFRGGRDPWRLGTPPPCLQLLPRPEPPSHIHSPEVAPWRSWAPDHS